jgi:hypothetical protein
LFTLVRSWRKSSRVASLGLVFPVASWTYLAFVLSDLDDAFYGVFVAGATVGQETPGVLGACEFDSAVAGEEWPMGTMLCSSISRGRRMRPPILWDSRLANVMVGDLSGTRAGVVKI